LGGDRRSWESTSQCHRSQLPGGTGNSGKEKKGKLGDLLNGHTSKRSVLMRDVSRLGSFSGENPPRGETTLKRKLPEGTFLGLTRCHQSPWKECSSREKMREGSSSQEADLLARGRQRGAFLSKLEGKPKVIPKRKRALQNKGGGERSSTIP